MGNLKHTDQSLQEQLKKLDHIPPSGWDIEDGWQKLEEMRASKRIVIWRYVEGIAATVLLLILGYFYIQPMNSGERLNDDIVVEQHETESHNYQIPQKDTVLLKSPTVDLKKISLEEKTEIVAKSKTQFVGKKSDFFPANEENSKEIQDLSAKIPLDSSSVDISNNVSNQLITQTDSELSGHLEEEDSVHLSQENSPKERPPVIYFSKPKLPPTPNKKLDLRLRKLKRMVVEKPMKKRRKQQYIGAINFRKP